MIWSKTTGSILYLHSFKPVQTACCIIIFFTKKCTHVRLSTALVLCTSWNVLRFLLHLDRSLTLEAHSAINNIQNHIYNIYNSRLLCSFKLKFSAMFLVLEHVQGLLAKQDLGSSTKAPVKLYIHICNVYIYPFAWVIVYWKLSVFLQW